MNFQQMLKIFPWKDEGYLIYHLIAVTICAILAVIEISLGQESSQWLAILTGCLGLTLPRPVFHKKNPKKTPSLSSVRPMRSSPMENLVQSYPISDESSTHFRSEEVDEEKNSDEPDSLSQVSKKRKNRSKQITSLFKLLPSTTILCVSIGLMSIHLSTQTTKNETEIPMTSKSVVLQEKLIESCVLQSYKFKAKNALEISYCLQSENGSPLISMSTVFYRKTMFYSRRQYRILIVHVLDYLSRNVHDFSSQRCLTGSITDKGMSDLKFKFCLNHTTIKSAGIEFSISRDAWYELIWNFPYFIEHMIRDEIKTNHIRRCENKVDKARWPQKQNI